MKRLTTVFMLAAVLMFTGNALAKGESKVAKYGWGMNFQIPTGDKATAGIMKVLMPNLLVGLDLGFSWQDGDPDANWGMLLGPMMRYYVAGTGPVNLYIHGKLEFAKNKDVDAQLALFGGFGVEWFVTDQFSLAGDTGLGIQLMPSDNLAFATFSHGLSANLYW